MCVRTSIFSLFTCPKAVLLPRSDRSWMGVYSYVIAASQLGPIWESGFTCEQDIGTLFLITVVRGFVSRRSLVSI